MGIKEVVNAPGKTLSIASKVLSIVNLLVGEVCIGSGIWKDLTPWGIIEISIALALVSAPVDISIIIKNLMSLKSGVAQTVEEVIVKKAPARRQPKGEKE